MIKEIDGDLTRVTGRGIIAHQVNPRVLGPFLALSLSHAYPNCRVEFYEKARTEPLKLGEVQLCKVRPKFYIAHCCGQISTNFGAVNTVETAVFSYLTELNSKAQLMDLPVLLPVGLGSGNGGADWDRIKLLIEKTITVPSLLVRYVKGKVIYMDELFQ